MDLIVLFARIRLLGVPWWDEVVFHFGCGVRFSAFLGSLYGPECHVPCGHRAHHL